MDYLESIIPYMKYSEVLKLSKLNKKFNNLTYKIVLHEILNMEKLFLESLQYNYKEYDEYYYKRKINLKILSDNIQDYKNIKSYKVLNIEDPVFGLQKSGYYYDLPITWIMFLNIYLKYPSPEIKLYPIQTIKKFQKLEVEFIRKSIYNNMYKNVITFIPLIHTYNKIVLYVNIINVYKSWYSNDSFIIIDKVDNLQEYIENLEINIQNESETKYITYNFVQNINSFIDIWKKLT